MPYIKRSLSLYIANAMKALWLFFFGFFLYRNFSSGACYTLSKAQDLYGEYANDCLFSCKYRWGGARDALWAVDNFCGSGSSAVIDGLGRSASFKSPDLAKPDHLGNIYVADEKANVIGKITPAGAVTTIAGNATAGFNLLRGLTTDNSGSPA